MSGRLAIGRCQANRGCELLKEAGLVADATQADKARFALMCGTPCLDGCRLPDTGISFNHHHFPNGQRMIESVEDLPANRSHDEV